MDYYAVRIESVKNEYIKSLRKLAASRSARREAGLFIAEGEKCTAEALGYAEVECVLISDESRYAGIAEAAREKGVRVVGVSRPVIEAVTDAKNPQGIAAVVRMQKERKIPESGIIVALEDVSDPQNIGSIIRTADAAAAGAVLLSDGCADPYNPRAVRSSMGSLFHLPVIISHDFIGDIERMRANGRRIVAGHLLGGGRLEADGNAALLIGNESRGLSASASGLADSLYKIPIYGRAESLNASVAAGIMLYMLKGL